MKKIKIKLKDIEAVKTFVNAANLYPFEIDLLTGRYIIDAKSIMGVLSLDLSQPIEVVIHTEQCAELVESIQEFILEEK